MILTAEIQKLMTVHLSTISQHLSYFFTNPKSGSPAKSGPPVFATKNSFPSFCAHQKGLVHMF